MKLFNLCICQNGHLPLLPKLFSKMPLFWNYLAKCFYFKFYFLKIEFQWKTRFLKNRVMWNQTKKKKKHGTRVPFKISHITQFHQIEFQKICILLHLLGERGKLPFWPMYIHTYIHIHIYIYIYIYEWIWREARVPSGKLNRNNNEYIFSSMTLYS